MQRPDIDGLRSVELEADPKAFLVIGHWNQARGECCRGRRIKRRGVGIGACLTATIANPESFRLLFCINHRWFAKHPVRQWLFADDFLWEGQGSIAIPNATEEYVCPVVVVLEHT